MYNINIKKEWITWDRYLSEYKGDKINILEIGSYEGVATNWFLSNLMTNKKSKIYCIDTWKGSPEYVNIDFKQVEKMFNEMVKDSGKKKQIVKMKMTSFVGLNKLISQKINDFDIIYIDASHSAKDVISDLILAWSLLKYEGIMILDDYEWAEISTIINRPKIAIDTFIKFYKREINILSIKYQVIIQKVNAINVNHILLMRKDNVLINLLKMSYNYFDKLVLINDILIPNNNNDRINDKKYRLYHHTELDFNFTYKEKKNYYYEICYGICGFDKEIIDNDLLYSSHFNYNDTSISYALFNFIFPYQIQKRISTLNKLYLFKNKQLNEKMMLNNITNMLKEKVQNRKDYNDIIKLYNNFLSGNDDQFRIYFVYYYKYIDKYLDNNNINILYYKYNFNNYDNNNKISFFNILDNCKKVNNCEYYYSDNSSKIDIKKNIKNSRNTKSTISNNYLNIDKINNKKSDFIFIHADFYYKIKLFTNKYNVFLIYLLYFILFKQKENGLLIIQGFKIPNHSVQIDFIYILTLFYKEINIDKLDIIDKCNIDLTIYGIGFKGINKDILNKLKDNIDKIEYNNTNTFKELIKIFKIDRINYTIMNKIVDYNKTISSKVIDIYNIIIILYEYLNRKNSDFRIDFINEYYMKSIDLFIKFYNEYGNICNKLIE